jgi:hypothetical protein
MESPFVNRERKRQFHCTIDFHEVNRNCEETMADDTILTQRKWTEQELHEAGFKYYERRKRLVLARELPPEEAPLKIRYEHDTLIATAGYMICFDAGAVKKNALYDYEHWPVAPDHFRDLYLPWDQEFKPNSAQRHLLSLGCNAYYNAVGVWAKRLDHPQMIQGVEHRTPVLIPKGAWLLLGAKGSALGAPYWSKNKPA